MRIRLTIAALALCLLGAAPAAAQDDYAGAIALERAGNLPKAAQVLAPLTLTGDRAKHRAALAAALNAFAAADVYKHNHQRALAESTLTAVAKQIDPVRDVYVRSALEQRLKKVTPPKTGFVHDVRSNISSAANTVGKWIAIAALVALLIFVVTRAGRLWRWAFKPKRGVGVALTDLTVDPEKRLGSGRSLGRELSNAIKLANARTGEGIEPELDQAKDLDGSIAVNVRVAGDELTIFDGLGGSEDQKVDIGPLQFNAREVLSWLVRTFVRPTQFAVYGTLVGSGKETELAVDLTSRPLGWFVSRKSWSTVSWNCSGEGDAARSDAVTETAHWVIFQARGDNVSSSWPSVSAYRQAKMLLASSAAPDQREQRLIEARRLFERSIGYDPTNALARYELATVMRKLGANREAAEQFTMVRDQCAGNEYGMPAFSRNVEYNRAMALCKVDDRACNTEAVQIFRRLTRELDTIELDPAAKLSRRFVYRSSLAAALLVRLERMRDQQADAAMAAQSDRLLAEITAIRDEIRTARVPDDPRARSSHNQSLAVAENAVGRARYLLGRDGAIDALAAALRLVPSFGQAHVNMASALFRDIARYPDWETRIGGHLDRALEASPNDARALYWRGELYWKLLQHDDAAAAWTKAAAAGSDQALLRLAEASWRIGTDDARLKAIALAMQSQVHAPAYDKRARQLILWTATMEDKVDAETLGYARDVGMALREHLRGCGRALPDDVTRSLDLIVAKLGHQPANGDTADAERTRSS